MMPLWESMENFCCSVCHQKTGGYRIHNGTEGGRPGMLTSGNGPVFPRLHGGCPGENIHVAPALKEWSRK